MVDCPSPPIPPSCGATAVYSVLQRCHLGAVPVEPPDQLIAGFGALVA